MQSDVQCDRLRLRLCKLIESLRQNRTDVAHAVAGFQRGCVDFDDYGLRSPRVALVGQQEVVGVMVYVDG